jgi:hypothetical protein
VSSRKQQVQYHLNSGEISHLEFNEIKAILRAADELIATGGRSMLAKVLKGSKDKKLLEHELDLCPVYGYYKGITLSEISYRIDFVIEKGYLDIQYNYRLPIIVYTEKGWEIERKTYAEELYQKLEELLKGNDFSYVAELKDRNRGMILLLIEKIKNSGNPEFISLLKTWQSIEYKKVRIELQKAINNLILEDDSL